MSALTQPAPILEHLRIRGPRDIPQPLFDDIMPRLRSLELEETKLPWSAPIFRGLTQLTIKTGFRPRPPLKVHHLLDIFRSCPELVNLSLDQSWTDPNPVNIILEVVTLSSLRQLNLCVQFWFSQTLLKYLSLPPSVNVNLNWRFFYTDDREMLRMHHMFPSFADLQGPAELFVPYDKTASRPVLELQHISLIPFEQKLMFNQSTPPVLPPLLPERLWSIATILDVRSTSKGANNGSSVFTEWEDLLDALSNLRTLKFTKDDHKEVV
ncbi:hypothetical protein BD410DRAFT_839336 [Rickenella mellea]|uniref:F-box domain-containing protein n=1 Tax=Rickenella mellea TaxID=50990 RepID=A0A4Y7Q6T3_9AGAM|nr:hypothetical protein BD410DRAFT_839336 [Rickenella mellea]